MAIFRGFLTGATSYDRKINLRSVLYTVSWNQVMAKWGIGLLTFKSMLRGWSILVSKYLPRMRYWRPSIFSHLKKLQRSNSWPTLWLIDGLEGLCREDNCGTSIFTKFSQKLCYVNHIIHPLSWTSARPCCSVMTQFSLPTIYESQRTTKLI